jgi:hypothetical protein
MTTGGFFLTLGFIGGALLLISYLITDRSK